MTNSNIATQAAREDAQSIMIGVNLAELLKSRIAGGIVSDPLYTANLIYHLPEDLQGMVITLLEKFYFDY